ncbi:NAD(P)-binding domain-containing protein [Streptomyces sp. CB03238]|uniref:NADPH-dependent F420 reductase n=1 Tax=Streptomyces sp. CB03238 TaxID=1907777 RepID=UPI0026A09589
MKIAILGTGAGARCHAAKLIDLGHDVTVGTRSPEATLARSEPDMMGTPPFSAFLAEHPELTLATFADAAAAGELVINGIDGAHAVTALTAGPAPALAGKVLIDYAVPYVYQQEGDTEHPWPTAWGVMPRLDPVDTDSLAERIQRALPDTKVVKTFVTQEQATVVNPAGIAGGDHTMFLAGNDPDAKDAAPLTAARLRLEGRARPRRPARRARYGDVRPPPHGHRPRPRRRRQPLRCQDRPLNRPPAPRWRR